MPEVLTNLVPIVLFGYRSLLEVLYNLAPTVLFGQGRRATLTLARILGSS